MATFKFTGLGAGSARTDSASLANVQDGTGIYVATVGGTADVITLTASPAITAYTAGQTFSWIASGANTTNVTVNVSGLGAKALTKNGTTALVANDILSGALVTATYDGTRFQLNGEVSSGNYLPISGGTLTGNLQIDSTDAGATAGPLLTLYRNSATPAASDLIGQHIFSGEDSAGNTQTYATITGNIVDPTSASEDGQIIVATVIAGTLANRVRVGAGVFTENATGGDQGADTVNASGVYDDGVQILPLVSGTAQATTSGTTIDFTGIPATAKRITFMFSGLSANGTSGIILQLGDSGGFEDTGYSGGYIITNGAGGGAAANASSGFNIGSGSASYVVHGTVTLSLLNASTNTWVGTCVGGNSDSALAFMSGASKSLSGTLTQIRLTNINGTDAFDAGSVNILYE